MCIVLNHGSCHLLVPVLRSDTIHSLHVGLSFTVLQEAPDAHVLPPAPQQDDIRTEYHPHSSISAKTDHFADFCGYSATHKYLKILFPRNCLPHALTLTLLN
jgi:hypothetical protein